MKESTSLRCRVPLCLILAGFLLLLGTEANAITILVDDTITDTIMGVSTERTGGNDMVGMTVQAVFASGFSQTLIWSDVWPGDRAGGVQADTWSLSINGNTYPPDGPPDPGAAWVFSNFREEGLVSLTLDAEPGLTVFDRDFRVDPGYVFPGIPGTPNSEFGYDFLMVNNAVNAVPGTATYSRQVQVGSNAPFGDIWHVLTLEFPNGGLTNTVWSFEQDTDNHRSVPEPNTVLLLSLGLIGLGAAGRRRKKNK